MKDIENVLAAKIQSALEPLPTLLVESFGPGGPSLFYEALYSDIQAARREEDASLPQGVWQRSVKKVDWKAVESLCLEALTHQSKDLQIAAWLTEAWIHLYGLMGFQGGLSLLHDLCST